MRRCALGLLLAVGIVLGVHPPSGEAATDPATLDAAGRVARPDALGRAW